MPSRLHISRKAAAFILGAVLLAPLPAGAARVRAIVPPDQPAFAVPRLIVARVAPFASLSDALGATNTIDWDGDPVRARAVTIAYAAHELQSHLARAGAETAVQDSASPSTQRSIVLLVNDGQVNPVAPELAEPIRYSLLGTQGYSIVPADGDIVVAANTAVGLLYGVYALLRQLGFAWDDPYSASAPDASSLLQRQHWRRVERTPWIARRGFWVYGSAAVPDEFAIWMARNGFNLGGRPRLPLQRLLGIQGWAGDHDLLQQEFSAPGLFEAHPDWYAEVGGVRRPIPTGGPYFNPSFASTDAADYFATRLIERIRYGDLRGVDILNVWPADTRFNVFDQSAAAKALGNETDNLLFFYSNITRRLREAYSGHRLSRPVTVAGISYFQTMEEPTNNAVVAALATEAYLHLFYPIDRDWNGRFDEGIRAREANRRILSHLNGWRAKTPFHDGIVEYYNASFYAGITLTDHLHLTENLELLAAPRETLYAYMHPSLRNPGPRRLTHALLSVAEWRDLNGAENAIAAERAADDYFVRRYGSLAGEWREIYALMARSVANSKEMFGINSLSWLLFQEQIWGAPLYSDGATAVLIQKYRTGGVKDIPTAFSGGISELATFVGLDESLALQAEAQKRWQSVLASAPPDARIRENLEADVVWFEATVSRYNLLTAVVDLLAARRSGRDESAARAVISGEISRLQTSPVTDDTVSPLDQRAFLDPYRQLLGARGR